MKSSICEREELFVGYIYNEMSPVERQEFEAHLMACPPCQAELDGLRDTRLHLALWSPPQPDLGFRVTRGGSAPAPALPRSRRMVTAFAFAAAAVLVLAAGAGLANIEVQYGGQGIAVRTGWGRAASPVVAQTAASPDTAAAADRQGRSAELEFVERRLNEIESALAGQPAGSVQQAASTRMSDADLLRRVRQIVIEAESRQEAAVTQRLADVMRDLERQRRTDIAIIQQGLGQYQGLTNAEIATNRDMLNQLVRAASTKQEK